MLNIIKDRVRILIMASINDEDSDNMCGGNYSFLDPNNFSHTLPVCSHNNIDKLLDVKADLLNFLDTETIKLHDPRDPSNMHGIIQEFVQRGNVLREELKIAETEYQVYRDDVNSNLEKISAFMVFVTTLNSLPTNNHKLLEESISILIRDINDKVKMDQIKIKYTTAREKYMIYLNELLNINQVNMMNKCSICLTNIVSSYYDPCGHTICDGCDKFDTEENVRCPICRTSITFKRKLFFI